MLIEASCAQDGVSVHSASGSIANGYRSNGPVSTKGNQLTIHTDIFRVEVILVWGKGKEFMSHTPKGEARCSDPFIAQSANSILHHSVHSLSEAVTQQLHRRYLSARASGNHHLICAFADSATEPDYSEEKLSACFN